MGNNIFCVDVDDTVLFWKKGYIEWMNEKGWYTKPEEECNVWEMSEWFKPHVPTGNVMTPEMSVDYITEFNTFPRCLKPFPFSIETLKYIQSIGYDIKAITSFGSCPKNSKFRQDYLEVVFDGVISECVVLDLGSCKEEALKEMSPKFFVEDNASHAQKAIDLGIDTFLINTPYNQGVPEAIYVDDWKDIWEMMYNYTEGSCTAFSAA